MGGRHPKYNNVEELQELIDKYFDECDEKEHPYTVSGLAYALNMTREGLIGYEHKDAFADTVKRAKMRIQAYAERSLYSKQNPAGIIFSLKNNYGWKDKQEIESNVVMDFSGALQAARERTKLLNGGE